MQVITQIDPELRDVILKINDTTTREDKQNALNFLLSYLRTHNILLFTDFNVARVIDSFLVTENLKIMTKTHFETLEELEDSYYDTMEISLVLDVLQEKK